MKAYRCSKKLFEGNDFPLNLYNDSCFGSVFKNAFQVLEKKEFRV